MIEISQMHSAGTFEQRPHFIDGWKAEQRGPPNGPGDGNVDQDDIYAVRCHCSEHRRSSIGCDQETKSSSQRPTDSGNRSAHRPTCQSLQSRSHRRWYPWLQSNARAFAVSLFPIRLSSCATADQSTAMRVVTNVHPAFAGRVVKLVDKCGPHCPHAASNRLRDDSAVPSSVVFATSFTSCKILCPDPAST